MLPRLLLIVGSVFAISCDKKPAADEPKPAGELILATTTSTQDSGFLDELVPLFTKQTGVGVKVIAVGSGAALQMGAKGDADVLLTHAPSAEKKLIDSGDLVECRAGHAQQLDQVTTVDELLLGGQHSG